jgi:hypothetical protein
MATYFGYVEREADSYVNWADVGRNMSATIDNIQRVRDEKKALIEKAYREDLDFIQANPTGENKSLREKSIEFANSAAENLKLKYNMLKQGKASVKDFTSFRQNITDDTENLYGTLNKMQEEYKRKMDRAKAGDSQYLERRNMELLEQYDMSKTDLFVNGVTGAVTIGLMEEVEENGQKVRRLTKDPNKFISVNQYKAAVTEDYNNYDPLPALAGWVEQHGEVIESLRTLGSELQAGSILEVTDITGEVLKQKMEALGKTPEEIAVAQKAIDDWNEAKNTFFASELANEYNFLAILTDQKKFAPNGKQYIPTYNIDDLKKGKEYIYIERNNVGGSVPTFEKHHEEDALKYLDLLTRPLLDKKVKMSTYTEVGRQKQEPRAPSAAEIEAGQENRTASAMGTYIRDIYSGNMAKKQETLKILQADGEVIPSQTYYKTGKNGEVFLHVTRKSDGESTDIKITNEDGTPYQDVVTFGRTAASWLYGGEISNKILMENQAQFDAALNVTPNFTPFDPDKKQNELWDRPAIKEEVVDPFIGIGNSIDKVDIFGSIQATAASDLKTALGGLGKQLTIKKSGTSAYGVGYDRVTVTAPNGEKIVLTTGYGSGTANKEAKDKEKGRLMTWLKENVKPELE